MERGGHGLPAIYRRRVTRRSLVYGAAGLGGVLLGGSMIGCGGSSEPKQMATSPGPTTSALPKRGGTVTLARESQMTDLNPHLRGTGTGGHVYDHLYYPDAEGRMHLSLASSFEQPDQITYIFKIKANAKHQNLPPVNGRNVTSYDVVASWDAFVANPRAGNKVVFTDVVDRCETPDAATLVVKAKKPYAWTLSGTHLAGPLPSVVIPKELIEQNLLARVAVGPGAYLLDQFDPASVISYVRRPDGWHTGDERPYVDKWVFRVITDPAAREAAFRAKQIDQLTPRDKLQAEEFKTYGPDMVIDVDEEAGRPGNLYMRADPEGGLFADVRVREAVYCALDIKELIEMMEMGDGNYSGPVPTYNAGWVLPQEELKKSFPHDIAKGKQLLASANWNSNTVVDFKYPARQKDALYVQLIQKYLELVGIKTRLVPQDPTTIWSPQTITGKDFQLTGSFGDFVLADPNTALMVQTTAGRGDGNTQRWSDAEVDAIVAKQQTEFDREKQRQLVLDAQRLLLKKFTPGVVVYTSFARSAYWSYYHPPKEQGLTGLWASYGQHDWTEKR